MNVETRTRVDKRTGREVKSYVARVYHPGLKRQITKTFPRMTDARSWGADTERKVKLGESTERPDDITVGQLAERYLANLSLDRTRAKRKTGTDKWVAYFGKSKIVSHLKRSDVKGFARSLQDAGYKPSSAGTYMATLKAALSLAVEDEFIRANPAAGRIPGASRGKRTKTVKALTHGEHERLLAALPERYRPLFDVWPRCGLRIGEMRGLKWANVDLDKRRLHVVQQWQDGTGYCAPKAGSSGTVILSRKTVKALREWQLLSLQMRNPLGLVFPGERAAVMDDDHLTRNILRTAATKAGLEWVTPHTMRHTFGSWLLEGGVTDLTFIQKQMRHATLAQTVNCYLHPSSDNEDALAEMVDGSGAVNSPFTQAATGTSAN